MTAITSKRHVRECAEVQQNSKKVKISSFPMQPFFATYPGEVYQFAFDVQCLCIFMIHIKGAREGTPLQGELYTRIIKQMAFTEMRSNSLSSILQKCEDIENLKNAMFEFVSSQSTSSIVSTIDQALDLDPQHKQSIMARYRRNVCASSSSESSSPVLSVINEKLSSYQQFSAQTLIKAANLPIRTSEILLQYLPDVGARTIILSYVYTHPLFTAFNLMLDCTMAYNKSLLPETLPDKNLHIAWIQSAVDWSYREAMKSLERAWERVTVTTQENRQRLIQITNLYQQRMFMEIISNYDSVLHGGWQFLTQSGKVNACQPVIEDAISERHLSPSVENTMVTFLMNSWLPVTHYGWNQAERAYHRD